MEGLTHLVEVTNLDDPVITSEGNSENNGTTASGSNKENRPNSSGDTKKPFLSRRQKKNRKKSGKNKTEHQQSMVNCPPQRILQKVECIGDAAVITAEENRRDDRSDSRQSNKENSPSSSGNNKKPFLSRRQKKNRKKSSSNSTKPTPQQPKQEQKSLEIASSDATHSIVKNQANSSSAKCELGLEEESLYKLMVHFTLQRQELYLKGFPILNDQKEVRILKVYFPPPYYVSCVTKKYHLDTDYDENSVSCEDNELGKSSSSSISDLNKTCGVERTCVRCNNGFLITENEYLTKERCLYHWGKLLKSHIYACCKKSIGAAGCSSCKYHVWDGLANGVNERLNGFVKTKRSRTNKKRKVYALDCEMCYTVKGLELCRVVILSFNGTETYNHFIKPENEVVDYNTRFSGVTESDVNGANSKTFQEMQKEILDLIGEETILLGHGLENDLRVLKLLHTKIVDTSLIFPHERGHPYRYSLKHLMATNLNKHIRSLDSGHDLHENAMSCLQLIFHKIKIHYGSSYLCSLKN